MSKPALRVITGGGKPPLPSPQPPLNFFAKLIARWVMSAVRIDPEMVESLRALAARGTIVYVMRYRSLVDYLLVLHVLAREGLPVPVYANDVPLLLLQPFRELLSTLFRRLRAWRFLGGGLRRFEERDRCQRLVAQGKSVVVFMRHRSGVRFFGRRRGVRQAARTGSDYLREIVHSLWDREQDVFLVPLAVIRGRGYRRRESRIATLLYSLQEAPGEAKRLASLAWNHDDTHLSVGTQIPLRELMESHRAEGEERIVRRVSRMVQLFLQREERVVWGPPLLPKHEVRRLTLEGDDLVDVVRQVARQRNEPESKVWRRAEAYFDEMAANFHGSYFAILEYAFNKIWPRVFTGLEYSGLEKVIECVKRGPVVLVPCHRSHFDYLILSYIFHNNFLSPPHIFAGINLSFWPLGPLFRGAGAYFVRRSFDGDPLYKMVFKKYLTFLLREGYTQEFFIEGGRSRTGKILTPKLGTLSAIVNAFIDGVRRDLYLVPVSIQYGRVVEEEAYSRELRGAEKEKENVWSLLKARTVLQRKHGTVYVTFAEPISLDQAIGKRKDQFRAAPENPAVEEEKRRFIQKLGFRLLREVNGVTVAGASAVTATVLLGAGQPAVRMSAFLRAAQTVVRFLRDEHVAFSSSLERNATTDFREVLSFLESGGLVQRIADPVGEVLHVPQQKRMSLDFYKNNTIHIFLLPCLLVRGLLAGFRGAALRDEVSWWLSTFRWEFALPEREDLAAEMGRLLDHLRAQGVLLTGDVVDPEHPFVQTVGGLLDNFQEAYWIAARVLAEIDKPTPRKAVIDLMRKRYETALLLGEVRKPEGNSSVTLTNAIERFREIELVAVQSGPKDKDRILRPGPRAAELPALVARLTPGRT